jgi:hypothetical protein
MASDARQCFPINEQAPVVWIGEHQVQRVALIALEPPVRAINHLGRPVPRQHVPAPAEHVGGLPGQAVPHPAKRLIDPLCPRGPPLRRRPVVQDKEVAPFGWIEPQGFGEHRENLVGRPHVPPLFQPSVPSGSDAGGRRP